MKTKSKQQENLLILLFRALNHHNTWGENNNTGPKYVGRNCSFLMLIKDGPMASIMTMLQERSPGGDYQKVHLEAGGGAAAAAAAC